MDANDIIWVVEYKYEDNVDWTAAIVYNNEADAREHAERREQNSHGDPKWRVRRFVATE